MAGRFIKWFLTPSFQLAFPLCDAKLGVSHRTIVMQLLFFLLIASICVEYYFWGSTECTRIREETSTMFPFPPVLLLAMRAAASRLRGPCPASFPSAPFASPRRRRAGEDRALPCPSARRLDLRGLSRCRPGSCWEESLQVNGLRYFRASCRSPRRSQRRRHVLFLFAGMHRRVRLEVGIRGNDPADASFDARSRTRW